MCIAKTEQQTWDDDEELRTLRLVLGRRKLLRPMFARMWRNHGNTDDLDSTSDSEDDARSSGYEDRDVEMGDEIGGSG